MFFINIYLDDIFIYIKYFGQIINLILKKKLRLLKPSPNNN